MELLLGLLAIVTGCFSSALGFQLMKLSSVMEASLPLYGAPRWLAGFFLLAVVQTLADALSLSFLPLSVVAPFAGLTICFTLLLASSGLFGEPEELSRSDLVGALCVLLGVASVSVFSPHPAEEQTVDELAAAAAKFALPLGIVLVSVAGCLGAVAMRRPVHIILAAAGAASCGALSQTFLKLVSLEAKESIGGESLFEDPTLILSLSGLLFTAPSQLRLLTAALAVARASLAVPLYQSSLIAFTTSIGGVAFNEFASMQGLSVWGYSGGLLLATVGLVLLSMTSEDTAPASDSESGDEKRCWSIAESEAEEDIGGHHTTTYSAVGRGGKRRTSMRIVVPAMSGVGLAVIETQNVRQQNAMRGRSHTLAPPRGAMNAQASLSQRTRATSMM
ncbi:hypothetical protein AB1Y20_022624 [Prymnesium parvum]|uniref:Magnesium transporter n=1 Tax=Prymnesium parvum TaxID=97485 RepID=A0AB34JGS3_PRYPA